MQHEPRAICDFETRSECDLKKHGSWRYSLDPTTQILCLAFLAPGWDENDVGLWHPAFPHLGIPETDPDDHFIAFLEWIELGGLVEAHNSWFERGIWTNVLGPRFGFPPIRHEQWRCSAAKAAALALPRSLGDAVAALKLSVQKDAEGHALMKKISKPRKALKNEKEEWANEHGTGKCVTCKGKGKYKRKTCAVCNGTGSLGESDAPGLPTLWHEGTEHLVDLFSYCQTDVLAEKGLSESIPDLNPQETELYLLDQKINERGFQLDIEAVDAALAVIADETVDLNSQLALITDGVVTKATQRERMKDWFATRGLELDNTQGATIDAELEKARDETVKTALGIVRELGRSSTGKYQAMARWRCPDGRVRGGLLYHGATTGRWSGAGVQPHNFVRGKIKDQNELWRLIKTRNRAAIRDKYGSVMFALANALRGAICAPAGKQLYVADYASIEARVLLWLAQDEQHLALFRSGADLYCDMASTIYGYTVTKDKHPDERALGKVACLAADTLIFTDSGLKRLIDVSTCDRVWDGEAWISHKGIICNGVRPTIDCFGISLTPDHLLWTGTHWLPANEVVRDERMTFRTLATASAHLPYAVTSPVFDQASSSWSFSVLAVIRRIVLTLLIYFLENRRVVTPAPKSNPQHIERSFGVTQISYLFTRIANACLIAFRQLSVAVKSHAIRIMPTMGGVASAFIQPGWTEQQGDVLSWHILSRCQGGTIPTSILTAKTTTEVTNPAIFGSSRAPSTPVTNDRFTNSKPASANWKPVYDLVDAGPQHRFMVLTNQGPLLVHNCLGLGYQMGWRKFVESAKVMGGITISEEMSQQTVTAYRAKYFRVVNLWNDQEQAAIDAVSMKRRVTCGYVTWIYTPRFLFCQLPSGRRLAYPFPDLEMRQMPWGDHKLTLTFEGVDPYTRQWKRQSTYGGMIVENLVQAIARDIMADAMLRCEESGVYAPVLSVHDELVAECDEGVGDVKTFERILTDTPPWAAGCPIVAEGYQTVRYRK